MNFRKPHSPAIERIMQITQFNTTFFHTQDFKARFSHANRFAPINFKLILVYGINAAIQVSLDKMRMESSLN